jgi:5-methylthioadenosine/S-adenosylhomocysteine deaminase
MPQAAEEDRKKDLTISKGVQSLKRLAVKGAYIIREPSDFIKDGYVIVDGDTVTDITTVLPEGDFEIIGGAHDIVMPGLINTHGHAPMSLMRGVADDLRLEDWLFNHIFPLEAKFADEEFAYTGTMLSCLEMIQTGTTAFADGYMLSDYVGKAALEAGMRAWLGEGLMKFPTKFIRDPAKAFDILEEYVLRWKSNPLIRPTVFAHSVYSCEPAQLQRLQEFIIKNDILMQIHVSETETEVDNCRKESGVSPVGLLDRLGCLSDRMIAVHCVAVDDSDIEMLAKAGVSVAHCPRSNKKLASGIAPVDKMEKAGINVSIGTDGCASNNNLDMFQEMATAAKLHKVDNLDPTVLGAADVLRMATINAARTLRFEGGGRIKKGGPADIIVLNGNASNLVPVYNPVSHTVYAAHGLNVKHSVIAGRVVMKDFKCLTIDEDALIAECRKIAEKIAAYKKL